MHDVARLREVREHLLVTQAELALRTGLTQGTISRLETGRHQPRLSTVRRLARALGVPPSALMAPPAEGAA